jgi:spore coat protein U-like protein
MNQQILTSETVRRNKAEVTLPYSLYTESKETDIRKNERKKKVNQHYCTVCTLNQQLLTSEIVRGNEGKATLLYSLYNESTATDIRNSETK